MSENNDGLFKSRFLFFKRKIIQSFCIAGWDEHFVQNYSQNKKPIPLEPQFFISDPDNEVCKQVWKTRLQVRK